jgi:hypothetical protein
MDWIHLGQCWEQRWALVITAMNLRVPQNTGKYFSGSMSVDFIKRTEIHGAGREVN